jgi:hypothetical protein
LSEAESILKINNTDVKYHEVILVIKDCYLGMTDLGGRKKFPRREALQTKKRMAHLTL